MAHERNRKTPAEIGTRRTLRPLTARLAAAATGRKPPVGAHGAVRM